MIQQLTYASVGVSILVFVLFVSHYVSSPFTVPGAIPLGTLLGLGILALFLYLAHVTEAR